MPKQGSYPGTKGSSPAITRGSSPALSVSGDFRRHLAKHVLVTNLYSQSNRSLQASQICVFTRGLVEELVRHTMEVSAAQTTSALAMFGTLQPLLPVFKRFGTFIDNLSCVDIHTQACL